MTNRGSPSRGGTTPERLTHHPAAPPGAPDKPHAHDAADVLAGLDTDSTGLRSGEAERRAAHFGANRLPDPPPPHPTLRFFAQFHSAIIYVLLAAALVKALTQDYIDATVILAVVLINATVGLVQEGQAERALRGIRQLLSPHATVRRDEKWEETDASALVPGDIIRLSAGDRAPADARMLEAREVRVDEAALTGESEPAAKHTEAVAHDAALGERHNMLHAGSILVAGRAVAVVTATGIRTELGRIQQLVRDVERTDTPLIRSINRLGRQVVVVVLGLTGVMSAIGFLLHGDDVAELLSASIAFAVAAIPEGLPAVVTITLALGVQQMAARRAITRRLAAVETLGSVTVICSDKTGTLTKNEMTVRAAAVSAARFTVTGDGYDPEGAILPAAGTDADVTDALGPMALVFALCNDARLERDESQHWRVIGDPTEGALICFSRKVGVDARSHVRRDEIPFSSDAKYMATLHADGTGALQLSVKGAPDRILALCTTQREPGGASAPVDVEAWRALIDDHTARGMRVLAAARRATPTLPSRIEPSDLHSLEMLGVVAIADPPRPEATAAIRRCQQAGVQVKMITGDHALTARAIAQEMRLRVEDGVLTGADIDLMDDEELRRAVADVDVYARTSPEHKLRVVGALQQRGAVVAMTGDGVNDAPALTRADVGVAMGMKGTEAAKDASDLVLADDNFATIERAVEEGRRVYDNLRKCVVFILSTALGQALVVFTAVVVGFDPPLEPTQILWVNLITAVTLSLAFAYEPVESGVMQRAPRPPGESILSGNLLVLSGIGVVVAAATIAAFFGGLLLGRDLTTARTVAVAVLVLAQVAVLFNVRLLQRSSLTLRVLRGNRMVWISIGILALLQTAYTYVPALHTWFGSAPLTASEWGVAFAFAAACFVAIEAVKASRGLVRRAAARSRRRSRD